MSLSRKQLGLVFAKLREKGLLKYLKKGKGLRSMGGSTLKSKPAVSPLSNKYLDSIFSSESPKKLLARLPEKHQKMTMMTGVKIWDAEVLGKPGLVGGYDMLTGKLHVSRSPLEYNFPKGYDKSLPLHSPRGSLLSKPRYRRNAKLGAAKSFYHEFAHSLWGRLSSQQKQAFPAMGEWDGVFRDEAWADAYSFYATSKISRNKLKQNKPLTFKYMKSFFEEK